MTPPLTAMSPLAASAARAASSEVAIPFATVTLVRVVPAPRNRVKPLGGRRDNVWSGVVKALVWDLRPRVECRNEYRTQFLIKIMDSFED